MWLLDTRTGFLHWFHDPSLIKYAILSHVWLDHEDTFQDLQRFRTVAPDSVLEKASMKLKKCCETALRLDYHWVWIDTCCIDKTSSAELSEAIISMYRWYQQSNLCIAFLHDVNDDEDPSAPESSYRKSRWFSRGWTLQELVAPSDVVFFGKHWSVIGTKANLADVISKISGIDTGILTHVRPLGSASVARRMSWASQRETTRKEDLAYSLMGIFDVHIPIMYGEGPNAFYRLQEAILRQIPDQSLFAWGRLLPYDRVLTTLRSPRKPVDEGLRAASRNYSCLFAPSPDHFVLNRTLDGELQVVDVFSIDELSHNLGIQVPIPEYTFTSYGIGARFPVLLAVQQDSTTQTVFITLLACRFRRQLVALLCSPSGGAEGRYEVGLRRSHLDHYCRGILLEPTWLPQRGDSAFSSYLAFHNPATPLIYMPYRPSEPFVESFATRNRRKDILSSTPKESSPNPACPCIVVIRPWTRLLLEKAGFSVVLVSTPFEYLSEGRISPSTFIALCRGTERICIEFGKCAKCESNASSSHLALSVSLSSGVALSPSILQSHTLHNCREPRGRWDPVQLGKRREFKTKDGEATLTMLFSVHAPPITLYNECANYDLHIECKFKSPRPASTSDPQLHMTCPDPYSRWPAAHVQTYFPLWKGSPLWVSTLSGHRPELLSPSWASGFTVVTAMDYSPNGRYLATRHLKPTVEAGGFATVVVVWDILRAGVTRLWKILHTNGGTQSALELLVFSPDLSDRLACASGRKSGGVAIWSVELDDCLMDFEGRKSDDLWLVALAWSPDGNLIASCYSDWAVYIMDSHTHQQLFFFPLGLTMLSESLPRASVAFWRNQLCVVRLGRSNHGCYLWDYMGGTVKEVWSISSQESKHLGIAEDSEIDASTARVVVGYYSDCDNRRGATIVRGLATGAIMLDAPGSDLVTKFSPQAGDNVVLALSDHPSIIRIYNCCTGNLISTCEWRGQDRLDDTCFSPDGRYIASLSGTGVVGIWRSADGTLLRTLSGRQNPRSNVAAQSTSRFARFSPTCDTLASGALKDGTIRIWPLHEWEAPGRINVSYGDQSSYEKSSGGDEQLSEDSIPLLHVQQRFHIEGFAEEADVHAPNARKSIRRNAWMDSMLSLSGFLKFAAS